MFCACYFHRTSVFLISFPYNTFDKNSLRRGCCGFAKNIQECEQLQTLKEINDLQYQMLFDFCEKAGETHIPSGISADIYACMNYIRSHTNEAIRLEDVAAHIDRSTSFIAKKFKSELGFNPGAYISRCKLEEAKSLLTFTEKSLTEISNYLCYSSQAHFQTAFKKKYGMTPRQYRNKTQQI